MGNFNKLRNPEMLFLKDRIPQEMNIDLQPPEIKFFDARHRQINIGHFRMERLTDLRKYGMTDTSTPYIRAIFITDTGSHPPQSPKKSWQSGQLRTYQHKI